MTQNLALQNTQPTSLFPSEQEWKTIVEQAQVLQKSGFLPVAVKSPEQAIAIALKGREIGVPMMQAFAHISVINGKTSVSSELQLALIYKNCSGAIVDYVQTNNEVCTIDAQRPGRKKQRFSFSMEDAKRAGLTEKENWKKYPAAMLRARCVSVVAHAMFPDSIIGIVSQEDEVSETIDCEPLDVTSETTASPIMTPKSMSREELGAAIDKCITKLKLPDASVAQLLQEEFKKTSSNLLSDTEMTKLLSILQAEVSRQGMK
jgi:hypothetical protein